MYLTYDQWMTCDTFAIEHLVLKGSHLAQRSCAQPPRRHAGSWARAPIVIQFYHSAGRNTPMSLTTDCEGRPRLSCSQVGHRYFLTVQSDILGLSEEGYPIISITALCLACSKRGVRLDVSLGQYRAIGKLDHRVYTDQPLKNLRITGTSRRTDKARGLIPRPQR